VGGRQAREMMKRTLGGLSQFAGAGRHQLINPRLHTPCTPALVPAAPKPALAVR
jgi:hypothetical protein